MSGSALSTHTASACATTKPTPTGGVVAPRSTRLEACRVLACETPSELSTMLPIKSW